MLPSPLLVFKKNVRKSTGALKDAAVWSYTNDIQA